MTFVVDSPPEGQDKDTPANTIHTYVQDSKKAIGERLECSDSDGDAKHNEKTSTDFGAHKASVIGFIKIHSSYSDLTAFTPRKPGTLHVVSTDSGYEIYVVEEDDSLRRVGQGVDHGELEGILEDDAHPELFLKDTTRAMTGDLSTEESGQMYVDSYGSSEGNPVPASHVDLSWYDAHGAACITDRFVPNDISVDKLGTTVVPKYNSDTMPTSPTRFNFMIGARAATIFFNLDSSVECSVGHYGMTPTWGKAKLTTDGYVKFDGLDVDMKIEDLCDPMNDNSDEQTMAYVRLRANSVFNSLW